MHYQKMESNDYGMLTHEYEYNPVIMKCVLWSKKSQLLYNIM